MRLASHEVRWFFQGDLDESGKVYAWFSRQSWLPSGAIDMEFKWPGFDGREDVYCVVAPLGDLGLKWRNDEKGTYLDVKGRVAELGPVKFQSNAVGRVERWVKWQYSNAAVPEGIREAFDIKGHKQDLIRIKKNRILRKVRLDAFGNDEEVLAKAIVDRGLNIELTKLRVDEGAAFWTLGFEAFPPDDEQHSAFHRAVCLFLDGYCGPSLDLERSKSYAEWLIERAAQRR